MNRIHSHLSKLYNNPDELFQLIIDKLKEFQSLPKESAHPIMSEKTNILITYPGQFLNPKSSPLSLLKEFLSKDLKGVMTHAHILPFHPWSSDDGFACINFHEVEPKYGSWSDIDQIPQGLMMDCVFNHISAQSPLFQKALQGDPEAKSMFHFFSEEQVLKPEFQSHLQQVVRPRTSPLLTPVEVHGEKEFVWTTFGADQVDLNFSEPKVMMLLVDTLFNYIRHGARLLRIDAVPFFWKELGTTCSHHPKTHELIQLFRAIVDELPFQVLLVTESNVPHHENITYWGDGHNEAHLIYNFSLAPLILHALTFETSRHLVEWASLVFTNPPSTSFINFTATHDGIGMRGLEGLVSEADIVVMCDKARRKGGHVGMKSGRDGELRPYELNVTWASYLEDEALDFESAVKKVAHSHALAMFFPGLNTQYVHNFFGSRNWSEGVKDSGIARRTNRKPTPHPLEPSAFGEAVRERLLALIELKNQCPEFHPQAKITMHNPNVKVLHLERSMGNKTKNVYFNLTSETIEINSGESSMALSAFDLVVV